MVEQSGPRQEPQGEDGAPPVVEGVPADPGRRFGRRRGRWSVAKSGRPSWWEVPPYGYLEIESRNAPTRPRALRTLARAAAKAGLSWSPEQPLPAQGFVEAHERARLVFHARRELPRVTAVASQVMVTDSRLAEAELAARGVDRLGVTPDGSEDPSRRRRLDLTAAGAALACGVTLAIAMGYLTAEAGPAAVGLALLGLATAVSYAAIPDRSGAGGDSRSRSVAARLGRLQENRRSRRQLRLAQAREAAAQAAVNQLREELALLVPQLFAAEQAALLFWRYQVAIGDAAQHAFQQHLAAFAKRRSRGVWRPMVEWWSGATAGRPRATRRPLPATAGARWWRRPHSNATSQASADHASDRHTPVGLRLRERRSVWQRARTATSWPSTSGRRG